MEICPAVHSLFPTDRISAAPECLCKQQWTGNTDAESSLLIRSAAFISKHHWCSSRDSNFWSWSWDLVLMSWSRSWSWDANSWSWDTKSWSWSHFGPFKPWFLVLEVQNHVQNYDFSAKGSLSPKKHHFRVFGSTLVALQYFSYYL